MALASLKREAFVRADPNMFIRMIHLDRFMSVVFEEVEVCGWSILWFIWVGI